jgi:hypothetical protein
MPPGAAVDTMKAFELEPPMSTPAQALIAVLCATVALQGRWKVSHLDAKGEAKLLHLAMAPRRHAQGQLVFTLPMGDAPLPGIAAAAIGACAAALFERGRWAEGLSVGLAGEHVTGMQMARALSQALGEWVQHPSPDVADHAASGFPGAAGLTNVLGFKRHFSAAHGARRDVPATRNLHPGLRRFSGGLAHHEAALRQAVTRHAH